jgi:hypothetical protein
MLVTDAIAYERLLLGEPNNGQRWSDAQMVLFNDRAQKQIMRDLKWPPTPFFFNTIPGITEYAQDEPEILRILRLYVAGQPLVRTTKALLQGQQIQFDDQTGSGGGPNAFGAIITGMYTPQWTGTPQANYPVASSLGYPSPNAQPGYPGQRPRYYLDGARIGLWPTPSGAYPVYVDAVKMPPDLVLTGDFVLPDGSMDAIAWYVCMQAYFSDRSESGSSESRQAAAQEYDKALRELRTWVRQYDGFGPRGPKPLAYRAFGRSTINRAYSRH